MADKRPSATAKMRWSVAPYFIVDDVVITANFYRDKLGFHYDRFWGDPPCFCMVSRGGIIIMLSQPAEAGRRRPNRLAEWDGTSKVALCPARS